jgi:hypothetical protein
MLFIATIFLFSTTGMADSYDRCSIFGCSLFSCNHCKCVEARDGDGVLRSYDYCTDRGAELSVQGMEEWRKNIKNYSRGRPYGSSGSQTETAPKPTVASHNCSYNGEWAQLSGEERKAYNDCREKASGRTVTIAGPASSK